MTMLYKLYINKLIMSGGCVMAQHGRISNTKTRQQNKKNPTHLSPNHLAGFIPIDALWGGEGEEVLETHYPHPHPAVLKIFDIRQTTTSRPGGQCKGPGWKTAVELPLATDDSSLSMVDSKIPFHEDKNLVVYDFIYICAKSLLLE